jgi:hypothetical protein
MKFQKMMRVQLMLMGLGAGLMMPKPVFAQQDTDPTLFESASDASQPDQAPFNAAPSPVTATIVAADSTASPVVQEADSAPWAGLDMKAILALVVGIGSIVLLAMAEAMRGSRRQTWREGASGNFPAGETTN